MLMVKIPAPLLYRVISLLTVVSQCEPDDHPWPAQATAINKELRERIREASLAEQRKTA